MKKTILAGVAVLMLAGSSAVYAQHRPWNGPWHGGNWRHSQSRMSAEDRLAFVDARIAAAKTALQLTPEQEKSWPNIENAVRDFAKQRIERANASADQPQQSQQQQDPVAGLRERADRLAATAAGLKRIADAADPLYKTLDDGQKRRLAVLTRMGGRRMGMGMWNEQGFGPDGDRDFDRGPGRRGDMGEGRSRL